MSKLLLLLAFSALMLLSVGTAVTHNNELFLMASGSAALEYIREILAAILFVQLITHPPRHIFFRLLAGFTALAVAGWTIVSSLSGNMLALDTLSMLAAAVAIGITSLEVRVAKDVERRHSSNPLIA